MKSLDLEAFHKTLGAQFMEMGGWSIPASYGNVQAEYVAITGGAALVDLSCRDLMEMTGEDRTRFLNGQTTNDVAALLPGQAVYSAFVNAKGKMRADGNILSMEGRYFIDTEPGTGELLAGDLGKFIIADDVNIELLERKRAHLVLLGPKSPDAIKALGLPAPAQINRFEISKDTWVLRGFFASDTRFDLLIPVERAEEFAKQALEKSSPAGWQALEARRIELGIPRFGADMDENTLPPEAGIESRAVSYTKGCYIGQEVISRIKSVGHVNRRLVRLKFEEMAAPLPKGAKLTKDDGEAGIVTSCAPVPQKGWLGLGYLRRGAADGNPRLKAGGLEATIL